ncbi:MAG: TadE family protein [Acidimicrobiales bacterium]
MADRAGVTSRRVDERGSSNLASVVILFPVLIVMFMGLVQWGLYFHARQVVTAAAQDAVRAAQDADAIPANGQAAADAVLDPSIRSGLLESTHSEVTETDEMVRAVAGGRVRSLVFLPGFTLDVTGVAEGPKEQFVPEDQR